MQWVTGFEAMFLRMSWKLREKLCAVALCAALWGITDAVHAHPGGVDRNGCHVEASSGQRHCHPERARKSQSRTQVAPRAGDEGVFFGPFIKVTDGDSFHAKVQGVAMEFRLAGIDAPESDQPHGAASREALRTLIAGKQLVMVFKDVDRYGRVVATVWVDDVDVCRQLVARGAAWFDSRYADDESLFEAEQLARDAGRGLWGLPAKDRIEPWEWRARKRAGAADGRGRK